MSEPSRDIAPPLRVTLLREQVTEMIRQAILDMRLKPGQRLVDRELIEWTGVSRATIREAIRELAAEGLVDVIPMKGAVVAVPTVEEVREIYELRAVLEGFATRLFTERATSEQIRQLRISVETIDELVRTGAGRWDLHTAKNHYYDVIFSATGNATLNDVASGLLKRVIAIRVGYFTGRYMLDKYLEELRAILEAVENRDPEAAEAAARRHIQVNGDASALNLALWQDLAEQTPAGPPVLP